MKNKFLLIIFLLFAIGLTLFAVFTIQKYQTRATDTKLNNTIEAPYLRLENHIYGNVVTVDVLLNTNNQKTAELDLAIKYNADILEFVKDETQNKGFYKTIQINDKQPGKLNLSLFVSSDIGQKAVVLGQEANMVKLFFNIKNQKINSTKIDLEFNQENIDKTALILYQNPRIENPVNILKNAIGAEVIF